MTIGLDKALGLPSMKDLIKTDAETQIASLEYEIEREEEPIDGELSKALRNAIAAVGEGEDHNKAMDDVFDDTLSLARDTAEMAWQVDTARQARFLEVASALYKTAIDAKKEKRQNQLNTIKMALEVQRAENEARSGKGTSLGGPVVDAEGVILTDRNSIIQQAIAARQPKTDTLK